MTDEELLKLCDVTERCGDHYAMPTGKLTPLIAAARSSVALRAQVATLREALTYARDPSVRRWAKELFAPIDAALAATEPKGDET